MHTLMDVCGIDSHKVPEEAWDILGKGFLQIVKEPGNYINGTTLGLKNGTRLDQRNSAMSAVAGLLGVPKLVAKATNMKYLDNGNEDFLAMNRFPEGSPSYQAYEHIRDNWMHMDTGANRDDSIDFDDEESLVQQESGPSEFDQWLEDYDKKYEDPTLEAAEQRKADNASFLSL